MWKGIVIAVAGIAVGLALAETRGAGGATTEELIASSLEAAGENRGELEEVLAYFEERGDTLILQAAEYLIANMEGHSYVTYELVDSLGDTVAWDATVYPDYDSLLRVFEGIEREHAGLDFVSGVAAEDVETITAEYLIENIELAFEAWRTKPWARGLTFEEFREGVLPYRGSNEPLEAWRKEMLERYADLGSKMVDSTDPVEAARLINNDIMSWFTFDKRWYFHPTDQGLAEMKEGGFGRCEDMTNLTIFAMRANGIAVTSDYTPYWAKSGNNHAWNAILLPGGEAIPFMGAEANPREYGLPGKPAKVYRKSFGRQPGNLAFQKRESEKVPSWLGGKSYVDVTGAYGAVSDVMITLRPTPDDSVRFAYLCVFNDGAWKPIQWGWIGGNRVVFSEMARGVVYLPALYVNEEIVPAGEAFVLTEEGVRRGLTALLEEPIDLSCTGVMSRTMDRSSESVAGSRLSVGKGYELFYWDSTWVLIGAATAGDAPLQFLAPSGGLYRLVGDDSGEDERIFTWENGEQVWW